MDSEHEKQYRADLNKLTLIVMALLLASALLGYASGQLLNDALRPTTGGLF